jgi:hypothetical protein
VGGISRLAFRVWRRFLFLRIPPRFAFREKRISHKEHKGSTLIIFCVLCDLCGLLGPGAPPVEFPVLEFNPLCDLLFDFSSSCRILAAASAVALSCTMAISARVMPVGLTCWMTLRP